jgi:amino acid transporter
MFLLLSVLGKGTTVETAFLILIDMSLVIYFIPYLYLFVCFMVHCWRRHGDGTVIIPGGKTAALVAGSCGGAITLFAMVVAMFPPPGTANILIHELKLGGGTLLLVGIGLAIYWRAKTKRRN